MRMVDMKCVCGARFKMVDENEAVGEGVVRLDEWTEKWLEMHKACVDTARARLRQEVDRNEATRISGQRGAERLQGLMGGMAASRSVPSEDE